MSIFYCQDIDNVLFEYLLAEDLKNLSMVNKYYYNIINDRYKDLFEFFRTIKNIDVSSFTRYNSNYIVLLKSIAFGKLSVCKYLIKNNKYNMNIHNELPFRASVWYGHTDIMKYLLDYVKNINDRFESCYNTAFFHAIQQKRDNIIKILINHPQFDVKQYYEVYSTVFSDCSLETVEFFCLSNVNYFSYDAMMIRACLNKDVNVAKYVYNKYNLNFSSSFVKNATMAPNMETIKWFMTFDQWSTLEISVLEDVLKSASIMNDHNIVKQILTNELFNNFELKTILYLLYQFEKHNNLEMISFVMDKFDNIGRYVNIMFIQFLENRDYECIRYLLTKHHVIKFNSDINIKQILDLCKYDPDLADLLSTCCNSFKIERNADNTLSRIHLSINL